MLCLLGWLLGLWVCLGGVGRLAVGRGLSGEDGGYGEDLLRLGFGICRRVTRHLVSQ